jgi:hypothetical protein
MIFPWRPSETVALAALVTRAASGFEFKPLMPAWFIPCGGASKPASCALIPDQESAWRSRSIHLSRDRAPDDSATPSMRTFGSPPRQSPHELGSHSGISSGRDLSLKLRIGCARPDGLTFLMHAFPVPQGTARRPIFGHLRSID